MSKENTAVFIGHNECYGVTSEQIKEAIVSLIDKGVTDFLSGGQGGFDRLCGRCVYEVKKQYPNINNYLVIGSLMSFTSLCLHRCSFSVSIFSEPKFTSIATCSDGIYTSIGIPSSLSEPSSIFKPFLFA